MKLTDFLNDVGRPVAYYPKMKRITGSTTATILLCQFIYWRGKEADADGWLYKTSEQIENETGLSYNEQKTARKALLDAGLIQEHYARLDHQLRFLLNLDAINDKWGTSQTDIPECDDSTLGNDGSPQSLSSITETTTENTSLGTEEKKEILKNADPAWSVLAGAKFSEEAIKANQDADEAKSSFERELHFNPLPWSSNAGWTKLERFVVSEYQKDNKIYAKYDAWRKGDGKYSGALNNKNISTNPLNFIACFPDFLAHTAMSKKTSTVSTFPKMVNGRIVDDN